MTWEKRPYEGRVCGHIYPMTTMATVTMKDGTKVTLAWDPATFELRLDVPDDKAEYALSLKHLIEQADEVMKHDE